MVYLSIPNLYREQQILLFKRCYALEKVHGSSAHVAWKNGKITFFSGGESHPRFVSLFDEANLTKVFGDLGPDVTVYGEVYGGRCQGMKDVYGPDLKFIAFDVQFEDVWLRVPDAEDVVKKLGLEFVPYEEIEVTIENLDRERDRPSVVAQRRGMGDDKHREGVVCRPLIELTQSNTARLIVKHKGDRANERNTAQKVDDPAKLKVLTEAEAIANEWATYNRLKNVLSHMQGPFGMEHVKIIIKAMQDDVVKESPGEVVMSKEALAAISKRSVSLFKQYLAAEQTKE